MGPTTIWHYRRLGQLFIFIIQFIYLAKLKQCSNAEAASIGPELHEDYCSSSHWCALCNSVLSRQTELFLPDKLFCSGDDITDQQNVMSLVWGKKTLT